MKLILAILVFSTTLYSAPLLPLNRGGTASPVGDPTTPYNLGLAASASSGALTITLKQADGSTNPTTRSPVSIPFRIAGASSGGYVRRKVTSTKTLTISSGSNLGTHGITTEYKDFINVYAIDNAGSVELAASASNYVDSLQASTTAEGGAGAADSYTAIYSTTARSNVFVKLIGRIHFTNLVTPGVWIAPTKVEAAPIDPIKRVVYSSGSGTPAAIPAGNIAVSFAVNETVTATSNTAIPGLAVTLTTTGKPVRLELLGQFNGAGIGARQVSGSSPGQCHLTFLKDPLTTGYYSEHEVRTPTVAGTSLIFPVHGFASFDNQLTGPGTYTYRVYGRCANSSTMALDVRAQLMAYEID